MKKFTFLFIAIFIMLTPKIYAQVSTYNWSQSNNTYTAITGTTALSSGWDDNSSGAINIGFYFTFNGTAYNTCYVNANGDISFNGTQTSYDPISSSGSDGVIAAFGRDMIDGSVSGNGQSGNPIIYTTSGIAPNQIFTVQWTNCRTYNSSDVINFQIRLKQNGNVVEIMYGNCTFINTLTCQSGLRGLDPTDFNNRTTGSDWNATTAGTANSSSMQISGATPPVSGLTWDWSKVPCSGVPDAPVITTPILLTALCGGSSTTITATDGTFPNNGINFQWQSSASNTGPWTDVAGATSLTFLTPALFSTTWFRLKNICSYSSLYDSSGAYQVPVANVQVLTTTNGNRCGPGTVTLSATGTPAVEWWSQPVNGTLLFTGNTFVTPSINTTTTYYVDATNGTCTTNRIPVIAVVTSTVTPAIAISASPGGGICSGSPVTFTATPTNGGVPSYQWKKNGVNVATNANVYEDYTLANGDVINCVLTTSALCATIPTVTSNSITATVTPSVAPAVSITSNAGATICPATPVVFTATPVNGGPSPVYQWKKNGTNVGTGATYNDNNLNNGDVVLCTMMSNATCANPGLVGSNSITINVATSITPTASITTTPGTVICEGTNTTFTADVVGGGTNPVYVWEKNGTNVGTNNITYTDNALITGDQITLHITSNATCATVPTADALPVTMTVNPLVVPSISISVQPSNTICENESAIFTADITNGGNTPSYQWKINGVNMGTNSNSFTTNTLANGNGVTCVLTTSSCAAVPTVTTAPINMVVNPAPAATIIATGPTNICSNEFIPLSINPVAGLNYQWLINNTDITGATNDTYNAVQTGAYQLIVTNPTTNCANASNTVNAVVNSVPPSSITLSGNGTICQGQSITLAGPSGNGLSYQWFNDGVLAANTVANTYAASLAGDYTLVTNDGTCSDTSVAVAIAVDALPDANVTVVGNVLWVSPGQTYQWFFNNQPIAGATNYLYTALQIGSYSVDITNANGCSDTSSGYQINGDALSVNTVVTADNISLYPNPTTGEFTLSGNINTPDNTVTLDITDVAGHVVYTIQAAVQNGAINQHVTMSNTLPSGTYILRVASSTNKTIIPFTKR